MTTYVVVRVGVYDHGVVGVTSIFSVARGIAEEAAANENDNYHDFEIRTQLEGAGEYDAVVQTLSAPKDSYRFPRGKKSKRVWSERNPNC